MAAIFALQQALDLVPEDQKEELKQDAKSGDYKAVLRKNPNLVGGAVSAAIGPIAGNALSTLVAKMLEDEETGEGSFEHSKEIYLKHAKELASFGFADIGEEEKEIEYEETI